jgi:hypothetical protein
LLEYCPPYNQVHRKEIDFDKGFGYGFMLIEIYSGRFCRSDVSPVPKPRQYKAIVYQSTPLFDKPRSLAKKEGKAFK